MNLLMLFMFTRSLSGNKNAIASQHRLNLVILLTHEKPLTLVMPTDKLLFRRLETNSSSAETHCGVVHQMYASCLVLPDHLNTKSQQDEF